MPKSRLAQVAAALWLVACLGVLYFGYAQRAVHDMPVAFVWLMVLLSFPIGLLVAPLVGALWSSASALLGVTYQPFIDVLPYWLALVATGYVQWFIVVPKAFRKIARIREVA